jgi:signal transduction histidine kinase
MMRKKIYFIKLIRLWGIIFLIALASVIIGIDLVTTYYHSDIRMNTLRTDLIEQQKQMSKREVERVVGMMNYDRIQNDALKGTKSYMNVEKLQAEWMERINNIRFGKNLVGYLFANDWKGKSLAHGAQPNLINKELWEYKDSRGNKTTQLLIAESKKKDGGFSNFWWRKPDTGKESPKIVYSKGIPEWELFVGSGVYVDDIEQNITILQTVIDKQTKTKIFISLIIVVLAFTLFLIVFNLLSNRLRKDLNLFISFFDKAAFSDKGIDRETIHFVEFDQMAEYANKMLQDKINAQQDLLDEREQLEELVKSRTTELQSMNKELETFAYSVSHDLRAPLRHMSGFAKMFMDHAGEGLDDKGRRYLGVVTTSAELMGKLIDDLLQFSRTGRTELRMIQVDLGPLVKKAIDQLQPEIEGRNIEWEIGALPEIRADRAMMMLVLVNLISNAIKFTLPREKALIEIGTERDGEDETVFFVRDNGVGFDMKYVDKLFGVFQRLHRKEDFEGTGIGLANVKRIISRHGGRSWAEAEVDKGATIWFSMPK